MTENNKNDQGNKKNDSSLQSTVAFVGSIVGLMVAVTGMITSFRIDVKLYVVTIVGGALIIWFVSAVYIVFRYRQIRREDKDNQRQIEKIERHQPFALFSIGCVIGIVFSFFLFQPNRQYLVQGIMGTPTVTVSPIYTPPLTPTVTLKPNPTVTNTPTMTLTPIPSTATPIPILGRDCFNSKSWEPNVASNYVTSDPVYSENGCWDLSNWGFFARENGMTIALSTDSDYGRVHDIYIPISVNSIVTFTINVEKFKIPSVNSGYLVFGIINYSAGKPSLEDSRVIRYRYQPNQSANNFIQETFAGTRLVDTLEYRLNFSTDQRVEFITSDGRISVSFNDDEPSDFKINDFGSYAFWMGYALPQSADMKVQISDFTIKDNN